MAWRDALQPAAFRGVPFHVAGHEAELGRRVQLHEYPLRDQPYAEDLGRKSRMLNVEAYVLGPDYMAARNALLRAVEAAGPGLLVHPYLGELRVTVLGCKLRESTAEGGMARFALQLVEAGEATFPALAASTGAAVASAGDAASTAAQRSFEARYRLANRPAYLADAAQGITAQALAQMQAAVGRVRAVAGQVAVLNAAVASANRDLLTLIYTPASVAQALAGNLRQLVRNVAVAPREALALARVFYAFGSLLPAVAGTTASRRAQATNQAQLLQLVRVVAVAEGARAASALAFDSAQDAAATRDELLQVLHDAMLAGPDDATYDALRALRAAVVRDIAARGAGLARLVRWTPRATTPALVAAQQIYGSAARADELLARNRAHVRHPLFVPGMQPLEVLADAA